MVETATGPYLARCTLLLLNPPITEEGREHAETETTTVLLDQLVQPFDPILDYLTRYSGITPSLLENVATGLNKVRVAVLALVGKDDVLVGHSLENDLRVLGIVHENIVDTMLLYRGDGTNSSNGGFGGGGGRKHSLKHLTKCLLNNTIQRRDREGEGGEK